MRNRKGQVLPYMLVMCLILILSWAMVLNIAKILRDKMILQNNVDNAVISVANLQARTLNLLGATNHLMATILSTAGYPDSLAFETIIKTTPSHLRDKIKDLFVYTPTFMVPSFSTDKVCGSMIPGPFCDYRCNGINTKYSGVKKLRETINEIQKFQDLVIANYLKDYGILLNKFSTQDTEILVMPSSYVKDIKNLNFSLNNLNPQTLLGIKKNSKSINYFKTKNYCFDIKSAHVHFVKPEKYVTDKYSWYIQDENFYDKKLVAVGTKSIDKNYPLFKRIFDIKMPKLTAVASAGLYNVKGPMFPKEESVHTGVNFVSLSNLILLTKQSQMLILLSKEVSAIPVIGWVAATVITGLEIDLLITSANNFYKAQNDKQTPIYKYNEAEIGGWDAHLVPLN